MSCKISDVFLCFETLDMQDWNKEVILGKYEEAKKHLLAMFEKQLGIMHGEGEQK